VRKSKKVRLEEREDKKAKKIPLSKYTKGGKSSSLIALESFFVIVLAVVISTAMKGKAGIYVGMLALLAFITSITGFIIGINSFKEENKFMRYTYIGTIANAVIWIAILGMYLIYI
jgi:hypothetical protein